MHIFAELIFFQARHFLDPEWFRANTFILLLQGCPDVVLKLRYRMVRDVDMR